MNSHEMIATASPWYTESRIGKIDQSAHAFIKRHGKRLTYRKGNYILFDGDIVNRFLYIDEGIARCFVSNDEGIEKTVYKTDMFVAIECFFHGQPVHYNCIADEDTVIYSLDESNKNKLMQNASVRYMVLQALALKCRILGWQVADLSLSKPLQRMARVLFCYYFDDCVELNRPLLHREIAEMTGLHRVTITNYMSELRKMGIIEQTKHKTWTVVDKEALRSLAFR